MNFIYEIFTATSELLEEAAIYILFGILVGGLLKVFLNPGVVSSHLGKGRYSSVLKAAFLGIPIPLCSCGVLPAAASLKRQGANNGATTAFLISTPESGVDSIAISYALLDPIMTVVRPVAAFITATAAGIFENVFDSSSSETQSPPDLTCTVDNCCDGIDCPPETHRRHHNMYEKVQAGVSFAFGELWSDLVGWFFIGIFLAGAITVLVPPEVMMRYLGGGFYSMLLMLVFGIPLYICATASTPIAAALILKGVSPGAALVFLLVGPATNITSLTVLIGLLGKRATAIYLGVLAVSAVLFGLAVDWLYGYLNISPQAVLGQAAEIIPEWARVISLVFLLAISIRPLYRKIHARLHNEAVCSLDGCHDALHAGAT
ncbi:MAG: SO_0444 family Cu/Zn efflux transporter [Deltaproteobacteria bacterium]|nr:SO_0444 family Cu/Zn efflux transporter [Deltaproteobacteria bacterium]